MKSFQNEIEIAEHRNFSGPPIEHYPSHATLQHEILYDFMKSSHVRASFVCHLAISAYRCLSWQVSSTVSSSSFYIRASLNVRADYIHILYTVGRKIKMLGDLLHTPHLSSYPFACHYYSILHVIHFVSLAVRVSTSPMWPACARCLSLVALLPPSSCFSCLSSTDRGGSSTLCLVLLEVCSIRGNFFLSAILLIRIYLEFKI